MAREIERKFLVNLDKLGELTEGESIKQGYINTANLNVVRVRVKGDCGYLTLKGKSIGTSRLEYEYPIPVEDAEEILDNLCSKPIIKKHRYEVEFKNHLWEIDIFEGNNEGLVVAELELDEEHISVELPEWVRQEVTGDPKYYNVNLLKYPYSCWSHDEQQ